jgi:protein required for attachment to host cells
MTKSVMKPRRTAKLPQAPAMERRHKRTLIVVADGSRARFFEPRHDAQTLVPVNQADMVAPGSRLPTREIVTDRPGRGFSSARGGIRHAFEPAHDAHKLEKHKFTAALAQVLEDACNRREFDRLVLVAPRRSLGELHTLLSPQVQKLVSHEVAKDLTASTPESLWHALERVLPTPVLA